MTDAEQIYENNKDSVVVVRTGDGEGSGVVVGENLIATCAHVVDGGEKITVRAAHYDRSGVSAAKIIAASDRDLCLLETDKLPFSPVEMGAAQKLRVGQPVYTIGVPRGLGGTLSDGIVTRLWTPPPSADFRHRLHDLPGPLIQTNAAVAPGSSGGGLFDAEGRLVGVIAAGRGSLNFAVPVEIVGELLERDEKELRRNIETIACSGLAAPEDLVNLAWAISTEIPENAVCGAWVEMARHAAMLGDKELPETVASRLGKLAKADDVEQRVCMVAILCQAVALANVGRGDESIRLIAALDDKDLQACGYAFVVADCARHEGSDSESAKIAYVRLADILGDVSDSLLEDPLFVWALASAKVAMGDTEQALVIAHKGIDGGESDRHFLGFVGALGQIAAALHRREVVIGAKAVFHYTKHAALHRKAPGVGDPERMVALGKSAVAAAQCGHAGAMRAMLNGMHDVLEKGVVSYLPEDGTPDIPYRRMIEARGLAATALAIAGGRRLGDAFDFMKRVPVLEHLPVALVCAACSMRRESRKKTD